ncbi:MAG: hypothetical protein NTY19_47135 [Planctomycetota bacterium]|nr:hypothetical protein [Planctomycetota bacterium]
MNQITIDNPLTMQLHSLVEPVELVDANGQRVGHFVPTPPVVSDECPYSSDELEAMRREQGGRPLTDIWRSLGAKLLRRPRS